MTVLDVSLDDLFAYSKLQDLLSRIIAQVNDSTATVQQLAGRAAQEEAVVARLGALEGKLGSFDGNLQERLTAIEDGMRHLALGPEERMQALEKQSLEELQVLRSLTERLEAMGARQASLEESSKKPSEGDLAGRLAGLEGAVAALEAHSPPDLEARLGALEGAAAQPNALEGRVASLEECLAEGSLSDRVVKVSRSVQDHEAILERLQGQLANAAAALGGDGSGAGIIRTTATTATTDGGSGEVSAAALSELEARLEGLESTVSNAVDELLKEAKRQRGESESRNAETANGLAEVREALSALQVLAKETQALVVEEVRPELEASVEKEEQDVIHIMSHIKVLQAQVNELLPKGGSSSTTRCLSCHEKREQNPTKLLQGTDGKVYTRRPSTAAGRTEHVPAEGVASVAGSGSPSAGTKGQKEPKEGWLPDTRPQNRVAFQGGAGAPLRRYRDNLGSNPPGSPLAAAQRAAAPPHAAHVGQLLEKGTRQLSSGSLASTGHGISISACDGASSRPISPEATAGRLIVGPM